MPLDRYRRYLFFDEKVYQFNGASISADGEISSYGLNNLELADIDGSGRLEIISPAGQFNIREQKGKSGK